MTAMTLDTPSNRLLVSLLSQTVGLPPDVGSRLADIWQSAGRHERFVEFLMRENILAPSARNMLDLIWAGYINADDAAPLLSNTATQAIERLLPVDMAPQTPPPPPAAVSEPRRHTPQTVVTPFALPVPKRQPHVGDTIGRCLLEERLGEGGFGIVYRAMHRSLGIPVAVKFLHTADAASLAERLPRLRVEARLLAQLAHPHVVRVLDFEDDAPVPFLVMEYLSGGDLSRLLHQQGPLSVNRAVAVTRAVADALSAAHKLGIVHRDIKPANILLTEDGVVKLSDLGLSVGQGSQHSHSLADVSLAGLGTPLYLAPEQASDPAGADARVDLYALGATWYHLLTGQPPFRGESALDIILKHQDESPVPPHEVRPEVPASLSPLVLKLLAKSPDDRYASAEELIADLDRWQLELSRPPSQSSGWFNLFRRKP